MPDLSHLWQRFLLAIALLFGLAVGVAATVFGYSNTAPVTLGFSIFHVGAVPLWTVALVPLALVLVAGTVFHWLNGLHHFTEHMRHRRRVHELEAEVTSLKAHLDQLLEMPTHVDTKGAAKVVPDEPASPALAEPVASNGAETSAKKPRRRIALSTASETETVATPTDGATETEPREESSPAS